MFGAVCCWRKNNLEMESRTVPRGSSNSCKWNQIRRILILVLDAPSVFYFILFFPDEMEALVSFLLFFFMEGKLFLGLFNFFYHLKSFSCLRMIFTLPLFQLPRSPFRSCNLNLRWGAKKGTGRDVCFQKDWSLYSSDAWCYNFS